MLSFGSPIISNSNKDNSVVILMETGDGEEEENPPTSNPIPPSGGN